MTTLQVTVPDVLVPRLRAAARGLHPEYVELTDGQLFKKLTADYWRDLLSRWEAATAVDAARVTTSNAYGDAVVKAMTDSVDIT